MKVGATYCTYLAPPFFETSSLSTSLQFYFAFYSPVFFSLTSFRSLSCLFPSPSAPSCMSRASVSQFLIPNPPDTANRIHRHPSMW